MAFVGKPRGVDRDVKALRSAEFPNKPNLAGSRPGQAPAMDTITVSAGAGRIMDTIYAGGSAMHTIYAGDAVRGGPGGRLNTAFGGGPAALTWWGHGASANTAPGGLAGNYVTKSGRGATGVAVVTQKVVDPATREPVTVVYNRHTGLYLDRALNRWVPAPPWLSAQIR